MIGWIGNGEWGIYLSKAANQPLGAKIGFVTSNYIQHIQCKFIWLGDRCWCWYCFFGSVHEGKKEIGRFGRSLLWALTSPSLEFQMGSPTTFSTIHATIHLSTGECTHSIKNQQLPQLLVCQATKPTFIPQQDIRLPGWTNLPKRPTGIIPNTKCNLRKKPWINCHRIHFSGLISLMNSEKLNASKYHINWFRCNEE